MGKRLDIYPFKREVLCPTFLANCGPYIVKQVTYLLGLLTWSFLNLRLFNLDCPFSLCSIIQLGLDLFKQVVHTWSNYMVKKSYQVMQLLSCIQVLSIKGQLADLVARLSFIFIFIKQVWASSKPFNISLNLVHQTLAL